MPKHSPATETGHIWVSVPFLEHFLNVQFLYKSLVGKACEGHRQQSKFKRLIKNEK